MNPEQRWGSRTIDIDITLLHQQTIDSPILKIRILRWRSVLSLMPSKKSGSVDHPVSGHTIDIFPDLEKYSVNPHCILSS